MSFDMKYDRDGNPIKTQTPVVEETPQQEALPVEAAQEAQEPEEVLESFDHDIQEEVAEPVKKAKPTPAESFQQLKEAKLREERERQRVERERDEYARKLKEYESVLQKQQKPQEPEEDYNINVNPDDLVEGKHLSKVDKKIKLLEKQLKEYEQKTTMQTIESKLKSQYPDFDKIVSRENVAQLQAQYPELAQTLNSSTDLYSTAVSAYTMIKKFGIAPDEQVQQDVLRVQKNALKPRPLTSISPQQGESPLSRANAFANGLTEDLKKQLLQEMNQAKKQY